MTDKEFDKWLEDLVDERKEDVSKRFGWWKNRAKNWKSLAKLHRSIAKEDMKLLFKQLEEIQSGYIRDKQALEASLEKEQKARETFRKLYHDACKKIDELEQSIQ